MTTPPDDTSREPAPFGAPTPPIGGSSEAPTHRFCAVCGAALPGNPRFCPSCGTEVGSAAARGGPIAPRGSVAVAGATYELSGWWRRFAAVLIDGALISLVFGALAITVLMPVLSAFTPIFEGVALESDWEAAAAALQGAAVWLLPVSVISALLGLAFEVYGWSPGKATLGVRVVRGDGHRPGLVHGAARSVGKSVSGAILLIGYLWAAWDPKRQAWHDKFADTYVVRVPSGGVLYPSSSAPLSTTTAAKVWAGLWVLSMLYNFLSASQFASQIPRTGIELRAAIEELEADFQSDFELDPTPLPRGPRIESVSPSETDIAI